jgi:F-type H+-transporting ATPase subunit gamma
VAQLTQLKRKINSIQTTKKITHAIRLVSMSSYSKLEKEADFLKEYKKKITQTFAQVSKEQDEWYSKILFPKDLLDTKPLYIFISSAKGLCGSFNSNLIRYIERNLLIEDHQKPEIITIGQKVKREIQGKNLGEIILDFNEVNSGNLEIISKEIIEKIYSAKENYSSVSFYSNRLKNFFIQTPQKTTLIPTTLDFENEPKKDYDFDPKFEQNQNEILNFIAKKYIKGFILEILFQSLISENAARFLAMDSSNTNAEKMLEKLILQYNKSRQALITREVSELSANMG